jgi:hypothetical protein
MNFREYTLYSDVGAVRIGKFVYITSSKMSDKKNGFLCCTCVLRMEVL